MSERDPFLTGVYPAPRWPTPPQPSVDQNAQRREVLLVDKDGRPLLVKEPRPVGFRKP